MFGQKIFGQQIFGKQIFDQKMFGQKYMFQNPGSTIDLELNPLILFQQLR